MTLQIGSEKGLDCSGCDLMIHSECQTQVDFYCRKRTTPVFQEVLPQEKASSIGPAIVFGSNDVTQPKLTCQVRADRITISKRGDDFGGWS